jgi:hypothetical protein
VVQEASNQSSPRRVNRKKSALSLPFIRDYEYFDRTKLPDYASEFEFFTGDDKARMGAQGFYPCGLVETFLQRTAPSAERLIVFVDISPVRRVAPGLRVRIRIGWCALQLLSAQLTT